MPRMLCNGNGVLPHLQMGVALTGFVEDFCYGLHNRCLLGLFLKFAHQMLGEFYVLQYYRALNNSKYNCTDLK